MSFMLGGFANGLFQGAEGIFRMYGEAQHAHYYQALTKRMNLDTQIKEEGYQHVKDMEAEAEANGNRSAGALPTPGPGAPPVKNAPKGDMPDPSKLPPPQYLMDAKSTESTFAKTPYTPPEKPEPTFATTARESANQSAAAVAPGNPLSPPVNFYGPGPGTFVQRMMGPQPTLPTQPTPFPPGANPTGYAGVKGMIGTNSGAPDRRRGAGDVGSEGNRSGLSAALHQAVYGPHSYPVPPRVPFMWQSSPAPTPTAPHYLPSALPPAQTPTVPYLPPQVPADIPIMPAGGMTQNGPSMMPNMASSAPGIGAAILASMNPMAGATA